MSADRAPIRSYQRIFKPDRRVYQVEGRRLPVPGGVPLSWLGYALGALLGVIALSSRSPLLSLALAAAVLGYGLSLGGGPAALVAGAGALGGSQVLGSMLGTLDWPLKLLVIPALVATLATQATPDGRAPWRFALSWLALQLRPARRSLDRPLPSCDARLDLGGAVPVAGDWRTPQLRRARIKGPAVVRFREKVRVERRGPRGTRLRTLASAGRSRRGAVVTNRVELIDGETLELRP